MLEPGRNGYRHQPCAAPERSQAGQARGAAHSPASSDNQHTAERSLMALFRPGRWTWKRNVIGDGHFRLFESELRLLYIHCCLRYSEPATNWRNGNNESLNDPQAFVTGQS